MERRQVFATHGLLFGVAALLQTFVSGHEEAHPGAGGGRRVLTGEEEADQHPRDLVIVQGPSVSAGERCAQNCAQPSSPAATKYSPTQLTTSFNKNIKSADESYL